MYRKQPGTETEWIRKGPGSAQTPGVDEELTDRLLPVQDALSRLTAGFVAMEFRGCGCPRSKTGIVLLSSRPYALSLYRELRPYCFSP